MPWNQDGPNSPRIDSVLEHNSLWLMSVSKNALYNIIRSSLFFVFSFIYRTSYQCSWAAHFFAFSPWLWWCRGTWNHLNKTIRFFFSWPFCFLRIQDPKERVVQNASSYHCFCFCCSLAGDRCTAGEHGPDGKPCAICTLRSLRWIQHWSVADLAVPLLPTLFFCVVPVSADFVAQLLGLLIYHHRRRQIPPSTIQGSTP